MFWCRLDRPDMTFAVDWALQTMQVSIYLPLTHTHTLTGTWHRVILCKRYVWFFYLRREPAVVVTHPIFRSVVTHTPGKKVPVVECLWPLLSANHVTANEIKIPQIGKTQYGGDHACSARPTNNSCHFPRLASADVCSQLLTTVFIVIESFSQWVLLMCAFLALDVLVARGSVPNLCLGLVCV